MAQFMTPPDKMTPSERRFYELLRDKLDDDYLVWFNLASRGRRRRYPDYLIFHPRRGLLAIEVKGWAAGHLRRINPEQVELEIAGQRLQLTNPLEQARQTLLPFINSLQRDPLLRQADGKYKGHLLLPWGYGCTLSNCRRRQLPDDVDLCLEPSKTFYREDLDPEQDAATFRARLDGLFPYRFPLALSAEQIDHVRSGLCPDIIINPQAVAFDEQDLVLEWPEEMRQLDRQQEAIARSLGAGHRVIHGVAGSGKTLILQYRARQLAEELEPEAGPVLVVCYNKVLAARLRERLTDLPNIEVHYFHGLCAELNGRHKLGLNTSYKNEKLADQLAAALAERGRLGRYEAVLIDEGHDLAPDWIRLLVALVNPESERLLFLYDDTQTLYSGRRSLDFSLASVNIKASGRTKILRRNYRNSREIQRYAQNFLFQFISPADSDDDHIPCLSGEAGGLVSHIEPRCWLLPHAQQERQAVLDTLRRWLAAGVPPGEMAVLCYSRSQGEALHQFLRRAQLDHQDLSDPGQRGSWRGDRPTLCTMHSSKGLEFSHVIVCGIGQMFSSEKFPREQLARVIYVAMTRAKSHLLVLSSQEDEFTRALATVEAEARANPL